MKHLVYYYGGSAPSLLRLRPLCSNLSPYPMSQRSVYNTHHGSIKSHIMMLDLWISNDSYWSEPSEANLVDECLYNRKLLTSGARDLGVVTDSGLTMSDHVTGVCLSAYYQPRQLRMIVHAFAVGWRQEDVSSFIHVMSTGLYVTRCCSASLVVLLNGYSQYITQRHGLSLVLPDVNISLRCWDSSTGYLWNRELAVLVCKSLHGLAPPYLSLSDDCQLVTDVGRRHSGLTLHVCPADTVTDSRQELPPIPRLWNNLPTEIRGRGTTFGHYRRLLKAFLFV